MRGELGIPSGCGALSARPRTCPSCLLDARGGEAGETGLALVDHRQSLTGVIARVATSSPGASSPARSTSPAGWCFPAFIEMPHPYRQGAHLAAHAQPRRHVHLRARRGGRDRGARWSAEDVRRRMDFSAPLRLRARHRRAPHPHRLVPAAGERSPGPCSRKCVSAGTGRIELQARLPDHHRVGARAPPGCRRSCRSGSPPRCGVMGAGDLHAARSRRACWMRVVRAARRSRTGPRFPCRRDRRPAEPWRSIG